MAGERLLPEPAYIVSYEVHRVCLTNATELVKVFESEVSRVQQQGGEYVDADWMGELGLPGET